MFPAARSFTKLRLSLEAGAVESAFPCSGVRLVTQKKKMTWCRIITLGIIPEFQKRGLDAVFYWEIVNRAHALGVDLGEASWVLEDNDMMNRGAEVMNGDAYKKYRIYEIEI